MIDSRREDNALAELLEAMAHAQRRVDALGLALHQSRVEVDKGTTALRRARETLFALEREVSDALPPQRSGQAMPASILQSAMLHRRERRRRRDIAKQRVAGAQHTLNEARAKTQSLQQALLRAEAKRQALETLHASTDQARAKAREEAVMDETHDAAMAKQARAGSSHR